MAGCITPGLHEWMRTPVEIFFCRFITVLLPDNTIKRSQSL